MRQREDDDVVTRELLRGRGDDDPVRVRREVGLVLTQRVARRRMARDRRDAKARVPGQQAEELTARVPGGTGDRHSVFTHANNHTPCCLARVHRASDCRTISCRSAAAR